MEKWKENKIKYNHKYDKENYTGFYLRLRKDSQEEKHLKKLKNKNGYIRELILKDIENQKKK